MDWFNGWLEIKRKGGAIEKIHDLNFTTAQKVIEDQDATIEWALYHPSACSMK